jgi:hypothetical protein
MFFMKSSDISLFSQTADVFHGQPLPEQTGLLAGYSALIRVYDLAVPLPDTFCMISQKYRRYQKDKWLIFTPKHRPDNTLRGHLIFALKYEGVNLTVLSALFKCLEQSLLSEWIQKEPWSRYSRRIWFLFEWIMGCQLNIPDMQNTKINYVDVLDASLQYPGPTRRSPRHRVNNNLPGVPYFCPLITRTQKLESYLNSHLNKVAMNSIEKIPEDILTRAAAFLLLQDSKASYAIEGETPAQNRAERWGKAISQAGLHSLSHEELLRLQQIVITDFRFTHLGYRVEGGFIGEHDRATHHPIPQHISAKADDLYPLMEGLIATDNLLKQSDYNPVLAAAAIAFGFVFIHPFEDGNGRIHRYLIHHVLSEMNFIPTQVIFPISYVLLKQINQYKEVLEAHSLPRLEYIKWKPTAKNNVYVLNDTLDLYRFFDATKQAEYLFSCIKETIEDTFPKEIAYLMKYDAMKQYVDDTIDLPSNMSHLLIRFLEQNHGIFSKRAKEKEFSLLTDKEIEMIEAKFKEIF